MGQKINALNQKYKVKSALSNQEKLYNNLHKYGSFDIENVNQMSKGVETTFPGILSQKLKMYMHKDHEDGSPDYSPGDWNFENHPFPQELNYHDPEPLQQGTDTHWGQSPHEWSKVGGTEPFPWNDETTYFNHVKSKRK